MMSPAWRIAIRELSGGIGGFRIYLACIILGVAAIASAGSVTEVFTRGLAGEARMLLGGDAMFTVSQRRLSDEDFSGGALFHGWFVGGLRAHR